MEKKTVFIVDDDSLYAKALKKHLEQKLNKNKFRFFDFQSAEECLNNLYLAPDIVILDYWLNKSSFDVLNGPGTLRRLKQLLPNTAVIMHSSQQNPERAADLIESGAFNYIQKRIDAFPKLVSSIIETVNKQEAEQIKSTSKILAYGTAIAIVFALGVIVSIAVLNPEILNF